MRRAVLGGVGLALGVLAILVVPRCWNHYEWRHYKSALHDRAVELDRWRGWLETASCARRYDRVRTDADAPGCLGALAPLESDPGLPPAARAALHDWLAIGRAPDRQRVLDRVRKDLVPAARAAIRRTQADHATPRDYVWWRVDLGFALEDVLDRGYDAQRRGGDVAAAIAAPLAALRSEIDTANAAGAPVRELPAIPALARARPAEAWTALLAIDDNGEWDELERDNAVFGEMPSEPSGCDVE
ncbi:MAG TPA: hypothetical protein VLX92_03800 [Kofleriaceae bacterium]|nr:hypothetical protein [Kofleriaceae bacterium]